MLAAQATKSLRRPLLPQLLQGAVEKGDFQAGAIMNLAYVFALRVTSELLHQGYKAQFYITSAAISITGLKRKAQKTPLELFWKCTSGSDPLLCPHPWAAASMQDSSGEQLFTMTIAEFHSSLHKLLESFGVAPSAIG